MDERYEVVRAHIGGWFVRRRADGARVSKYLSTAMLAENACHRMERESRARVRPCLRCGRKFGSEGAHNRLCDGCRSRCSTLDAQMLATSGLAGV
ncbi:MAG: hypothetical protein CVT80_00455 [Alphaproteobacteria bacterium HGW-Alphaproteobacteria-2]|nr:MAG: hypothetical protein CVT80_00455 [Alphaproteobacteria bacterium HGW-Alphaproteobacteria-2]